jgi:hypothetical protein
MVRVKSANIGAWFWFSLFRLPRAANSGTAGQVQSRVCARPDAEGALGGFWPDNDEAGAITCTRETATRVLA